MRRSVGVADCVTTGGGENQRIVGAGPPNHQTSGRYQEGVTGAHLNWKGNGRGQRRRRRTGLKLVSVTLPSATSLWVGGGEMMVSLRAVLRSNALLSWVEAMTPCPSSLCELGAGLIMHAQEA